MTISAYLRLYFWFLLALWCNRAPFARADVKSWNMVRSLQSPKDMMLRELAAGNRHTTKSRFTSEDPGKWKRISDSQPADDSTEYALSITAPLDLLRNRMQLDLARRKKYQQRARNDLTSQQKLHNLGKRSFSATYWFSRYRNRLRP